MATLSIMGMYNYDDTLFDGLQVPSGIDKQDIVDEILMQCAELEVLYPAPSIMKRAIEIWSNGNQRKWQKLYDTMTIEYNPIWNVDANITDTENITGDVKRAIDRDTDASGNNTKSVKGFNETDWAEAEKNDITSNENELINETVGNTTERTYTQRRTGNIGVTTTQQMLEAERQIADFNLIDIIVNSFKYRFCILVY